MLGQHGCDFEKNMPNWKIQYPCTVLGLRDKRYEKHVYKLQLNERVFAFSTIYNDKNDRSLDVVGFCSNQCQIRDLMRRIRWLILIVEIQHASSSLEENVPVFYCFFDVEQFSYLSSRHKGINDGTFVPK